MRFNHMELTFEPGTLTDGVRAEIDAFYGDVFGWSGKDVPILGQQGHLLQPDPGQFILLTEYRKFMSSPGFDHLGLLYDTRAEVDALLARCKAWQARDDRVQIKEYEDLVQPTVTVHAFYVRYLLPIWFDVQVLEPAAA
jgi:hypothetical protein